MKFHHFGIACKDINKTSRLLKKNFLAKKIIGKTYDPNQKVFLSLFKIGNTKIELVSGNSVKKFQNNKMIYHICYQVKNIETQIKKLVNQGCVLVIGPVPAKIFKLKRVAFLYSCIGLIELLEI